MCLWPCLRRERRRRRASETGFEAAGTAGVRLGIQLAERERVKRPSEVFAEIEELPRAQLDNKIVIVLVIILI